MEFIHKSKLPEYFLFCFEEITHWATNSCLYLKIRKIL